MTKYIGVEMRFREFLAVEEKWDQRVVTARMVSRLGLKMNINYTFTTDLENKIIFRKCRGKWLI